MNALTWRLVTTAGRLMKGLHVVKPQMVHVGGTFGDTDHILDLGGGGEGVIGQVRGSQVTAIDLKQEELDEAPPGPIKIVADARELPFDDGSFDVITAFYFLMYVPTKDRPAVLREAYRVLRPGGTLTIWDTVIPSPPSAAAARKTFAVPVKATLPTRTIRTLYGTRWEHHEMSADAIVAIAMRSGFASSRTQEASGSFCLEFKRKD